MILLPYKERKGGGREKERLRGREPPPKRVSVHMNVCTSKEKNVKS
jgi:hypothetical protein